MRNQSRVRRDRFSKTDISGFASKSKRRLTLARAKPIVGKGLGRPGGWQDGPGVSFGTKDAIGKMAVVVIMQNLGEALQCGTGEAPQCL
jgi:hypothetical protein